MTSCLFTMRSLSKMGLLLKEIICSDGANSLFYEMTPIYMGCKDEMTVAFPGSVSIHLKLVNAKRPLKGTFVKKLSRPR